MIKTIAELREFGTFSDFHWSEALVPFKRYNLIFGWNYSGKTTFSRALRCFEQKQRHGSYASATVCIETDDGAMHSLAELDKAPLCYVYNTDFVAENIRFESCDAAPLLIIGAEEIEKQEEYNKIAYHIDRITRIREGLKLKKNKIEDVIKNSLRIYARDYIKNPLSVPDYDARKFLSIVESKAKDYESYILSDDILQNKIDSYKSKEKRSLLGKVESNVIDIIELGKEIDFVLKTTIGSSIRIKRLVDNPQAESWVSEGRALHKDSDICLFCGQNIDAALINELNGHFSKEYDELQTKIKILISKINASRHTKISLPHKNEFYGDFVADFELYHGIISTEYFNLEVSFKYYLDLLEFKKRNPFVKVQFEEVHNSNHNINIAVEQINKLIEKNNERSIKFEEVHRKEFELIECHYASIFIRDQGYNKLSTRLSCNEKSISKLNNKLHKLHNHKVELEKYLSKESAAADRINKLLHSFFLNEEIKIIVTEEKRFQIKRSNNIATNLSEGERTAIAFAYYITRVQSGAHNINDIVAIIDDPISSLDSNNMFTVYAIIKSLLIDCHQLFILTHSFEFFSLIKRWMRSDLNKDHSIYLIYKEKNGESTIKNIPEELRKFNSEYIYLFSRLYDFCSCPSSDYEHLLNLPNMARRFMEIFSGLMIPRASGGLKNNMEILFPDAILRERVFDFINSHSHKKSVASALFMPDLAESVYVIKACLRAIEDFNAGYYKRLEELITELVTV